VKAPRRTAARSPKIPVTAKFNLSNVDLAKTIADLSLMRPILFVPPSMLANDLMGRMQAQRIQIALVIDEYGGTDGLVSLEDIVEMVVGNIEDEHDDDEVMLVEEPEGVFIADARADLDEVSAKIGSGFIVGEHGEDVDTVGGLIFSILGRIPVRGEMVQAVPGYEFHVLEADPRRIRKVRIVPLRHAERRPTRLAKQEDPADQSSDIGQ
jgi:CBS domain containing-hemolysin-like protein